MIVVPLSKAVYSVTTFATACRAALAMFLAPWAPGPSRRHGAPLMQLVWSVLCRSGVVLLRGAHKSINPSCELSAQLQPLWGAKIYGFERCVLDCSKRPRWIRVVECLNDIRRNLQPFLSSAWDGRWVWRATWDSDGDGCCSDEH